MAGNDVYWDSCAWLGLINAEPEKVRALEYVYESARRGDFIIWTSTIAYVEVFRIASEVNAPRPYGDEGLDKIKEVLEQSFIERIPFDVEIGRKARGLRRAHALTVGDAMHLASALVRNINPLHTWDDSDLLPLNNSLSCKGGGLLQICVPSVPPPEGPLFKQRDNL